MKVKLKKEHFEYLIDCLHEKQPNLEVQLKIRKDTQFVIVELDEKVADEIRDWASEELQKKGFCLNFDLTYEGKILEDLIDVFYVN